VYLGQENEDKREAKLERKEWRREEGVTEEEKWGCQLKFDKNIKMKL
jgi:hypothetical protein